MQHKPLDEQVVVVFGASSGIGRETAIRFAEYGAKVVVAARSEQDLHEVAEEIRRKGGEALVVPADVTDYDQVRNVAERAVERFGKLDSWAHIASVSLYARFDETTPEEFEQVIRTNLLGVAYGLWAALPHLKRAGHGALVVVSSIEGEVALPYQAAYASSKHAVVGMLDSLRLELEKDGWPISVTNVMPAAINTPLFNHARTKIGVKPKGVPPIYSPGIVADQIVRAAIYPERDIIAGGAGKLFLATKRLSPRLMDKILLAIGFNMQRSREPKSATAPDNLYEPQPQKNQVEGDFGRQTVPESLSRLADRHPIRTKAAAVAAVGLTALIAARAVRS